jgi:hypothetical protein
MGARVEQEQGPAMNQSHIQSRSGLNAIKAATTPTATHMRSIASSVMDHPSNQMAIGVREVSTAIAVSSRITAAPIQMAVSVPSFMDHVSTAAAVTHGAVTVMPIASTVHEKADRVPARSATCRWLGGSPGTDHPQRTCTNTIPQRQQSSCAVVTRPAGRG